MTGRRVLGLAFALALAVGARCSRGATPVVPSEAEPPSAAVLTATSSTASTRASTARALERRPAPDDVDLLTAVRAERLRAAADHRRLVVYAGASWCAPCKKMAAAFARSDVAARLGDVTLLDFDADKDAARLNAAGYGSRAIPYFALPRADGAPEETLEPGDAPDAVPRTVDKLVEWSRRR